MPAQPKVTKGLLPHHSAPRLGSVYVFDGRRAVTFSEDAAVLSSCIRCGEPTARLENCADPSCRTELVLCAEHEDVRCAVHAAYP